MSPRPQCRRIVQFGLMIATVLCGVARAGDGARPRFDPAARGLDLFVHVPSDAIAGSSLPVQVEAIGFPTVTKPSPLRGATIEASWDQGSLAKAGQRAIAAVSVKADANGLGHLDIPVPKAAGTFTLLLAVRSGDHERVREIQIPVRQPIGVDLYVSDRTVVPGSTILAWAVVRRSDTGLPIVGSRVEIALKEGEAVRSRLQLSTGAAGAVAARIPIPRVEATGYSWTLSARPLDEGAGALSSTDLTPRDDTPGKPSLAVRWTDRTVGPGGAAPFTILVRDGSGEPLGNHEVHYRVGANGAPKTDDERWEAESTVVKTDAAGVFRGDIAIPRVVPAKGLPVAVQVRTVVFGHKLSDESTLTVLQARGPAGEEEREQIELAVVSESGVLIPGFEQRLVLTANDSGDPVVDEFAVEGDGLSVRVKTDGQGRGEFAWRPPKGAGAVHKGGDCSDGVAASLRIRRFGKPGNEQRLCVAVDPDATALVHVLRPLVRASEPVSIRIDGRADLGVSILARSRDGSRSVSRWLAPGTATADLALPPEAKGLWTVSALLPGGKQAARVVPPSTVLVVPDRMPKLVATKTGGRSAPGGTVIIDADLTDGRATPMPGTVAALVVDANGGGDPFDMARLDTRTALAGGLASGDDRDAFLESRDPSIEPLRRAALWGRAAPVSTIVMDPSAEYAEKLRKSFETVVHSLEGAVHQATTEPDRLRDIRRRGPRGWEINPEVETVIREALSDEVTTPGGEPLALPDVVAMDRQVDFNHVARRVARHKLFRALTKIRSYVRVHQLDPDEPISREPNAILRRLVKDEGMAAHELLDPWGGTLGFVRDRGPRLPFLSMVPGFQLHSPGPDGRLGTADDVRDPFERVLRSGTPYAQAVNEDTVVDAKWDMVMADSTVEAWTSLFDTTFGEEVGDAYGSGGLGLSGTGEGGGGSVTMHGQKWGTSVGESFGRGTSAITAYTHWLAPVRTDARGHVRLSVPLGPIETTWRVWLVALPDGSTPATTSVAIPVTLPVSARVDAGSVWSVGDRAEAIVTVRNHTDRPVRTVVSAEPKSCVTLTAARYAKQTLDIPAGGAVAARIPLIATHVGTAALSVLVRTAGHADDAVTHEWRVRPAGERIDVSHSAWVQSVSRISLPLEAGVVPEGPMRLVLEPGFSGMLRPVLDSLDPDRLRTLTSLADAIEVAARIHQFAVLHGGESDALTLRARDVLERSTARIVGYKANDEKIEGVRRAQAMAQTWLPPDLRSQIKGDRKPDTCPDDPSATLRDRVELLETAPRSTSGTNLACWDAFVSTTMQRLNAEPDPIAMALAALSLADRRERRVETSTLVARLREIAALRPSGEIALPAPYQNDAAARAIVLAALLRSADFVPNIAAPAVKIASWLQVQRDASGGFGSSEATKAAVRALLPMTEPGKHTPTVTVVAEGQGTKAPVRVKLDGTGAVVVPLDAQATAVRVQTDMPGVIARLERTVVRSWTRPPDQAGAPLRFEMVWPDKAKAGEGGVLRVSLQQDLGRVALVEVRVPLPPGVGMSEPAGEIRQANGVIIARTQVGPAPEMALLTIPIRFALAGRITAPEAFAYVADAEAVRAYAPARPIAIE
jgi:hypothetical protein